jgi:hypothetical protein
MREKILVVDDEQSLIHSPPRHGILKPLRPLDLCVERVSRQGRKVSSASSALPALCPLRLFARRVSFRRVGLVATSAHLTCRQLLVSANLVESISGGSYGGTAR